MTRNESLRLARAEAITNQIRSEMDDVMAAAYEKACADRDEEAAAFIIRKMRNKLLAESDREMALDRRLPAEPTGATFSAWLSWLRELAEVAKSNWSVYRQELRDIPAQEGFPFNVVFPEKPE